MHHADRLFVLKVKKFSRLHGLLFNIQDKMNYFSLFSLPAKFDINLEMLEQKYQILQGITHPDKFANASMQEQRMYLQKNTEVNDAYHVLSSPILRGEHLLDVRNVPRASEQETIGDTEFLMQQMELREQLASARKPEEFEMLKRKITESVADYKDQITLLLNENTEQSNAAAALELNKLKFVVKLSKEIKERQKHINKIQG